MLHDMGVGFMGLGWIFWIIILSVIIILLLRVTKNDNSNNNNSALHELKIRYAKGEITEDEFYRIKRGLN
jgi:putative membrane protein